MFFLFYLKIDPREYQSTGGTVSGGFKEKHRGFENFTFEPISDEQYSGEVLLVGKPDDVKAKSKKILKTIYYPDGASAVSIGEK